MLGKKVPNCNLKRPLAITAASAIVALSVGVPAAAFAADPLRNDVFYATSASAQPYILEVDPVTGTLSDAGIAAPAVMNQVGVSRDGGYLTATDTANVYRYTAATGTWDSVPRSTGPTVPNTHGALDPQTGHMFYGGLSGSSIVLAEYDPVTNTIASDIISIPVSGAPGGNGDLAFDAAGNLYIVLGAAEAPGAYSRLYRVDRAALASGSGQAVQLGGNIDAAALNSIAFGADGYLYVAGGQSGNSRYVQVDPGTGATVTDLTLSTRITDLASTAVPRTAVVGVESPDGLIDDDDSFEVVLENAQGQEIVGGTTDEDGNADEGPAAVVPDQEYNISLTPGSTTNPDDYDATWTCTDGTGATIASGTGTSGNFTYPGAAEAIDCTFVNIPRALPVAVNDEDLRNTQGTTVTVEVVGNDTGDALDPTSVTIVNGSDRVTELAVPGEGTWAVDADTGAITFVPEDGFTGNPTPITYEVSDSRDHTAQAAVVITYLPVAANDSDLDNAPGSVVTVPVVGNDTGDDLDPTSVRIIDPASGDPVTELIVPGEGTWTVDPASGDITFTPEVGFINNPTPITYSITDGEGETAQAEVVVAYLVSAEDDESTGNTPGAPVVVDVIGNDSNDVDPSTIRITDPETGDPVTELVVPGEGTWTVDPETGTITFTPEDDFTGNPTPIDYTGEDEDGNPVEATVTVTYAPAAEDDSDLGNKIGSPVTVDVVGNDTDNVDPTTVRITDPETGEPVTELVVLGEGTWTVDPATGEITFTPEAGFEGDPTPIDYTVQDAEGNQTGATVTVGYAPDALNDEDLGNEPGATVTVDVVGNDSSSVDPTTVKVVDPATGDPVTELVVPGEGIWTVDPETGEITFAPEDDFTGNPTPITYTVEDENGNSAQATVTVTYLPTATDDESLGNPIGSPVVVDVVGNDSDSVDPSTVKIVDPATGDPVTELVVPGEGTWTVDPETGEITFTPEPGFEGNPTPVDYTVEDAAGNETGATVTVGVAPVANDDEDRGNEPGTTVTVDVVGNDSTNVDPTTVTIVDPETGDPVSELVVPGEGTWTVDPETGEITFTPEDDFTGNPTPIDYTVEDESGQSTEASVTVTYLPTASDDQDLDNTVGTAVTISVVGNDSANVDSSTVRITDPATGAAVTELVVPGEGTWTVNPETGEITFTPEPGFIGDPTVIDYTVADAEGNVTGATVTVTYVNNPADDEDLGNTIGDPVTVDVVGNDPAGLDPSTVKIIDPTTGEAVATVVVPGEGTWTVNPETGEITFTPEPGFEGNPTPIEYVYAPEGQPQSEPATVTIGYTPVAVDDSSVDNARGDTVTVSVLDNDRGDLVPSTVRIIDPETGELVTELVVPGEGTWTVDPETGDITFTPEDGFEGNPTPIEYSVEDTAGVATTATVTIEYQDAVVTPVAPAEPTPGGLAVTGAEFQWTLAGLGALLVGLGASALGIVRRRKQRDA